MLRTVSYLSGKDISKFELERKGIKNSLEMSKTSSYRTAQHIDTRPLMKRISEIDDLLERKTPPSLPDWKKNKLYLRMKELTRLIKEGMPTSNEMDKDSDENVEKNYQWIKRTEKLQIEYRNICRIIDRNDMKISNIETMRRIG